jgi:hypothetical protein
MQSQSKKDILSLFIKDRVPTKEEHDSKLLSLIGGAESSGFKRNACSNLIPAAHDMVNASDDDEEEEEKEGGGGRRRR